MAWAESEIDCDQEVRKAYQLKAGRFSRLRISMLADEPLRSGEVRVQVKCIGLNFADVFSIMGLYSATPAGLFVPGLEFSGEILEIGSGVSSHRPGDHIMGVTRFGAYSERLVLDERYVLPLPAGWTWADGAGYLVQALTAYYGTVILGQLRRGQTLLVHSGGGGVGVYTFRIAKLLDAYAIGTTSSPRKAVWMRESLGYDDVIVRSSSFAEDLAKALDGRALDLIMECIGGRILRDGFRALAPQGRMVVYGAAQFASQSNRPNYVRLAWLYLTRPRIDPLDLIPTNRSILGFNLIWLYDQIDQMRMHLDQLAKLDLGKPLIGARYDFDHLPQAIDDLRGGETTGKVVVEVK